jgi:recombinational DNA repair ATPase RecF
MLIRQFAVTRFRGIESMALCPGRRTVLLGPNNAAKTTLLEALDLVLHPGFGRPRPAPDELDYYARDPTQGFEIEVVLGDLGTDMPRPSRLSRASPARSPVRAITAPGAGDGGARPRPGRR